MDLSDLLRQLFSGTTLIGILAALVGGWLLKKFPAVDNRLIPIATAIVAFLTQLINFLHGGAPDPQPGVDSLAAVAVPYTTASIFSGSLFKVVLAAVIQWLGTDKFYETQKKALDGAKEVVERVPMRRSEV